MNGLGEKALGILSLMALSFEAGPLIAEELSADAALADTALADTALADARPVEVNLSTVSASETLLRLHGSLSLLKAVSGHQRQELGFGAIGQVSAEWGWSRSVGLELSGAWLALADVKQEAPAGYAELNGASAGFLGAGVRLYPFLSQELPLAPGGLWLSPAAGVGFTAGVPHMALKAELGFDFMLAQHWALGPSLGFLHFFQENQSVRPADANLVFAGVHVVYDHFASLPPKDADGDLIVDPLDACPLEKEDFDKFQDQDGCPEPDNDLDTVLDQDDECPLQPEDFDDFEDQDGCPELDNDGDGILDSQDQCPVLEEDFDEFEDADGCPEKDNDQDGFEDVRDLCPNEKEVVNGYADHDGCPDAEQVKVVADHIELAQKIHFYTNSARLRPMSYPVLYKLALFLNEHPEYVKVRISGHSDQRGTDQFNAKVSLERAEMVGRYLIKNGVSESRVMSKGFGSQKLLVDGQDSRSHFLNRRVEFVVTREASSGVKPL